MVKAGSSFVRRTQYSNDLRVSTYNSQVTGDIRTEANANANTRTSINTERILSENNEGTQILFYNFKTTTAEYYSYYYDNYVKAINNLNSRLRQLLKYKSYEYNITSNSDLRTQFITNILDNLFIKKDAQNSVENIYYNSLININGSEAYRIFFNPTNYALSKSNLNNFINVKLPLYISWNKATPKLLNFIDRVQSEITNNYLINFGPCIFDELSCFIKILEKSYGSNLSDNIIFHISIDDNDFLNELKFYNNICKNIELYRFKSYDTFNKDLYPAYKFIIYNSENMIVNGSENIPLYERISIEGSRYNDYIDFVYNNVKTINNESLIDQDPLIEYSPRVIMINIPQSESIKHHTSYQYGNAVQKSLDLFMKIYNNFTESQKSKTKIYIRTNTLNGEKKLLEALTTRDNFQEIINDKKIFISSRNSLMQAMKVIDGSTSSSTFNNTRLNNIQYIQSYNFNNINVNNSIYNLSYIKNSPQVNSATINQITSTNLTNTSNISQLNNGYLDGLLINYLINSNIQTSGLTQVINTSTTIRKIKGENIYNSYKNFTFSQLTSPDVNNLFYNNLIELLGNIETSYNLIKNNYISKRFTFYNLYEREISSNYLIDYYWKKMYNDGEIHSDFNITEPLIRKTNHNILFLKDYTIVGSLDKIILDNNFITNIIDLNNSLINETKYKNVINISNDFIINYYLEISNIYTNVNEVSITLNSEIINETKKLYITYSNSNQSLITSNVINLNFQINLNNFLIELKFEKINNSDSGYIEIKDLQFYTDSTANSNVPINILTFQDTTIWSGTSDPLLDPDANLGLLNNNGNYLKLHYTLRDMLITLQSYGLSHIKNSLFRYTLAGSGAHIGKTSTIKTEINILNRSDELLYKNLFNESITIVNENTHTSPLNTIEF
tara:strand:+ start:4 stop:2706 length:2703 start_codon:yes stop_codon:yes gene_type:complete